jgi:hypothetical protein
MDDLLIAVEENKPEVRRVVPIINKVGEAK